LVKLRGLVNMVDGAFGGTAPNTTDPVPENVQLSFSLPQNVYCTPLTVMVLLCAWAVSAPNTASVVATEIGSSLRYFIIVRVVLIKFSPRIDKDRPKSSRVRAVVEQRDLTRGWC
jgi:hypothetical protein